MIHKEGRGLIIVSFLFLSLVNILLFKDLENISWLYYILSFGLLVIFILIVQFFRNPKRTTPIDPNKIYAPADGKVVIVKEVLENEYFKDKRIQVSIFMSPLNVHVNRNAISGVVSYFKYHAGKYLVAWHPKSSELNERTTVVTKHENGKEILVRQIAGALARRICWYVKEGDKVTQGEDFGFIKFGSRVDLFFPLGTKINAKIGDKPVGGETVIAEWEG